MGRLSQFFGFSEEQAAKDVKEGYAAPRNDAEGCAAADWMVDSVNSDSPSSGADNTGKG